jgi:hypothetical protein
VYLKTNGTESITINATVYKDGSSGSVDATGGVEIEVSSSAISNSLTSASTLRYAGQLWDLNCGSGGYQLRDLTGNASHALMSESGWSPWRKNEKWELSTTLTGSGYIGGSARTVLPSGHLLENIYAVGGSGITLSVGESAGDSSLVGSLVCGSGAVKATLANCRSSNGRVYVNYTGGTGNVKVVVMGSLE